jgi:hypothetical protein
MYVRDLQLEDKNGGSLQIGQMLQAAFESSLKSIKPINIGFFSYVIMNVMNVKMF